MTSTVVMDVFARRIIRRSSCGRWERSPSSARLATPNAPLAPVDRRPATRCPSLVLAHCPLDGAPRGVALQGATMHESFVGPSPLLVRFRSAVGRDTEDTRRR